MAYCPVFYSIEAQSFSPASLNQETEFTSSTTVPTTFCVFAGHQSSLSAASSDFEFDSQTPREALEDPPLSPKLMQHRSYDSESSSLVVVDSATVKLRHDFHEKEELVIPEAVTFLSSEPSPTSAREIGESVTSERCVPPVEKMAQGKSLLDRRFMAHLSPIIKPSKRHYKNRSLRQSPVSTSPLSPGPCDEELARTSSNESNSKFEELGACLADVPAQKRKRDKKWALGFDLLRPTSAKEHVRKEARGKKHTYSDSKSSDEAVSELSDTDGALRNNIGNGLSDGRLKEADNEARGSPSSSPVNQNIRKADAYRNNRTELTTSPQTSPLPSFKSKQRHSSKYSASPDSRSSSQPSSPLMEREFISSSPDVQPYLSHAFTRRGGRAPDWLRNPGTPRYGEGPRGSYHRHQRLQGDKMANRTPLSVRRSSFLAGCFFPTVVDVAT
ncbi:hypothetical protein KP509_02G049900 [Ceratopteris richardii]|uniref:Uncharacterized protein n=1 Tax=Ceratopteris richardii TaxID=49495 RepID=A0A8T2V981_CERRI|nr:hypothetical protein KP509_02G049900 [Ceratopteris richardii]